MSGQDFQFTSAGEQELPDLTGPLGGVPVLIIILRPDGLVRISVDPAFVTAAGEPARRMFHEAIENWFAIHGSAPA